MSVSIEEANVPLTEHLSLFFFSCHPPCHLLHLISCQALTGRGGFFWNVCQIHSSWAKALITYHLAYYNGLQAIFLASRCSLFQTPLPSVLASPNYESDCGTLLVGEEARMHLYLPKSTYIPVMFPSHILREFFPFLTHLPPDPLLPSPPCPMLQPHHLPLLRPSRRGSDVTSSRKPSFPFPFLVFLGGLHISCPTWYHVAEQMLVFCVPHWV